MKLSYDNKSLSYEQDNKEADKFFLFLKSKFHISKDDLPGILYIMFDLNDSLGTYNFSVYKDKEYETWFVELINDREEMKDMKNIKLLLAFDSFSLKENYGTIQLYMANKDDETKKRILRKSYFWNFYQHNN